MRSTNHPKLLKKNYFNSVNLIDKNVKYCAIYFLFIRVVRIK